jgi:hypothetical protein
MWNFSFIRKFTKGLFIDGRMVANPIVTPDFFETEQKGVLSRAQLKSIINVFRLS